MAVIQELIRQEEITRNLLLFRRNSPPLSEPFGKPCIPHAPCSAFGKRRYSGNRQADDGYAGKACAGKYGHFRFLYGSKPIFGTAKFLRFFLVKTILISQRGTGSRSFSPRRTPFLPP